LISKPFRDPHGASRMAALYFVARAARASTGACARNSLIDNTNFSRRHVGMPDALSKARQEQIQSINRRRKS